MARHCGDTVGTEDLRSMVGDPDVAGSRPTVSGITTMPV